MQHLFFPNFKLLLQSLCLPRQQIHQNVISNSIIEFLQNHTKTICTHIISYKLEEIPLDFVTDPTRNPSAATAAVSKKMLLSPHNPLNQFAEITLATVAAAARANATSTQKSHHQHDMLLAQYLSQLQAGLELTPSNSPSPPPAHLSPSSSLTTMSARMNNGGMHISPHMDLKKKPPPQQQYQTTSHTVSKKNLKKSAFSSRKSINLEIF